MDCALESGPPRLDFAERTDRSRRLWMDSAKQSQNPDRFYPYHEAMERQRGSEANCECAEAFFVMREKSPKPLMPFAI
ncbi:hypothetical protein B4Q13_20275 [Lacticaseibacillus rhamnosus]